MRFSREAELLISSLRGLPSENSDENLRNSASLGSVLEACIERYNIGKSTPEETILKEWSNIVGKDFARRCHPVRIDRAGNLVLATTNATVRRELIFMEDRILTAVGSLSNCNHIRRILLIAG